MLAYIVRRLLLMIPTLFGIMVINFVIVQAAPGGPVEQLIAQIQGRAVEATARVSGAGGGEVQQSGGAHARGGENSRYRGAQGLDPEFIKQIERLYGFDEPAYQRFFKMLKQYLQFDFGNSYFRDRERDRAGSGKDAGLDLDRPVDHAFDLSDLDSARDPQGGARRHQVRRLDQRGHHRRQRHSELPVRDSADRPVRRRQLLRLVPSAWPGLRQLAPAVLAGADPRLFLAHDAAAARADDRRLRRPDDADQELLSRGDQQAVRDDRQGQGPDRAPRPLRPRVPQRHADRDRRLPGRIRWHPVQRRDADRDHLLARRPRACWASTPRSTATTR